MKMIATKSYRYGGRALVAGDEFEATRQDARTLRAIGRAKSHEEDEEVSEAVGRAREREEREHRPRKHTEDEKGTAPKVKRRDMQAEDGEAKPKRAYKRRDLRAEKDED